MPEDTSTRPETEDEPTIGDLVAQVETMRQTVHYAAQIVARSTMTPEERAVEDAMDSIDDAIDAMEERVTRIEAKVATLLGGAA